MIRLPYSLCVIAALAALGACDRHEPAPTATAASIPSTDAWLGAWTGPEGTQLTLSRDGSGYSVGIQSLDGPARYPGTAVGDHLEFERAGKIETIRATDGAQTGMKWLADKTDCLTIQPGEGFCRR